MKFIISSLIKLIPLFSDTLINKYLPCKSFINVLIIVVLPVPAGPYNKMLFEVFITLRTFLLINNSLVVLGWYLIVNI